jgi:hypothetical protein
VRSPGVIVQFFCPALSSTPSTRDSEICPPVRMSAKSPRTTERRRSAILHAPALWRNALWSIRAVLFMRYAVEQR